MEEREQAPEPETEIVDDAALLAELDGEDAPEETPDPDPKPQPDEDGANRDDKYQNLSNALKEARYESRQFKRELEEIKGLLRPNAKQQPDPYFDTSIPDPDADPIGAVRALAQMVAAQRQQQYEQMEAQQRQQQEQQTIQTLSGYMESGEAEFRQQAPDYNDAASYLVQSRKAELKALGYADEQIDEGIRYEYLTLINEAAQRGQNPAALVYAQAKARGYALRAQTLQPTQADRRLEAMKQADTLPKPPRPGGGKGGGTVTEDMLMNAKGAEFDKLWSQFEKQNAQA
jgi:hypothetical protein